jgi:hypothetical protein
MADEAPPAEVMAEESAPAPEAPAVPEGPKKPWKAADKPATWKFPPTQKIKPLEVDEKTKLGKDQLKSEFEISLYSFYY